MTNIRKFLKWGLLLMAFLAYKQLEGDTLYKPGEDATVEVEHRINRPG